MLHRTQRVNTSYHVPGKVLSWLHKSFDTWSWHLVCWHLALWPPSCTRYTRRGVHSCMLHVPCPLVSPLLGYPIFSLSLVNIRLAHSYSSFNTAQVSFSLWKSPDPLGRVHSLHLTAVTLFFTFLLDRNSLRAVCLCLTSISRVLDT